MNPELCGIKKASAVDPPATAAGPAHLSRVGDSSDKEARGLTRMSVHIHVVFETE